MWTIFLEEPDPAIAVAERDEILARQPDAHRRAIRARRSRAPARPGSSSAASPRPSLSRVRSGSAAGFPHVKASSFLLPQSRRSSRPFARSRKRCSIDARLCWHPSPGYSARPTSLPPLDGGFFQSISQGGGRPQFLCRTVPIWRASEQPVPSGPGVRISLPPAVSHQRTSRQIRPASARGGRCRCTHWSEIA
jgi:hypothetical protein